MASNHRLLSSAGCCDCLQQGWFDVLARTALLACRLALLILCTVQEADDGDGEKMIQMHHKDIQVRYMKKEVRYTIKMLPHFRRCADSAGPSAWGGGGMRSWLEKAREGAVKEPSLTHAPGLKG